MAAARMTHQLEDARARQDFFTRMSREMWFEYTVQPSSLQLSLGAMQQTGLPAVMVDPLQNRDFFDAHRRGNRGNGAAAANRYDSG